MKKTEIGIEIELIFILFLPRTLGIPENKSDIAVNLHLRIGYRF
jgi:hypothetical protein